MARFTWGAFDDGRSRVGLGPMTVVEADRYVIEGGFVTFIRGEENIVSVPDRKVAVVSKLDDDNNGMFHLEESPKPK